MIGFRHPLPIWAWLLVAALAVVYSWWTYRGLLGSRPMRATAAGMRTAVILLLALLISGPEWVRYDEDREPYWLGVLVDRSASMNQTDGGRGTSLQGNDDQSGITRDQQLIAALGASEGWTREALADRQTRWLGFGQELFELPPGLGVASGGPVAAAEALDTPLRSAIDQTWERLAGRPTAGLVIFSDGRSTQPIDAAWRDALKRRGVPLVVVPLGPPQTTAAWRIDRVDHPRRAYIRDGVPIQVDLNWSGSEIADGVADQDEIQAPITTVRLRDLATDEILDEVPAIAQTAPGPGLELMPADRPGSDSGSASLTSVGRSFTARLTGRASEAGLAQWRVEVVDAAGTVMPFEADSRTDTEDDSTGRTIQLALTDQPLRVLHIEAYPRWEYRYLASLLRRETSISSSSYLLAAARGDDGSFVQEGNVPIRRLPLHARELADYDVIILGDVPASALSDRLAEALQRHVAEEAGGLIWIGGPYHTPAAFAESVLAPLLPMGQPSRVDLAPAPLAGFVFSPTAAAAARGLLRLNLEGGASEVARDSEFALDPLNPLNPLDPLAAWPADLPPLRWAQALGSLKPTAEVLMMRQEADGDAAPGNLATPAQALITRLTYGAGTSLYVATDELWRVRRGRGERYFEQIWLPLIRDLGRARVQAMSEQGGRLAVDPRRGEIGAPVRIELALTDRVWMERRLESVSVLVSYQGDGAEGSTEQLTLLTRPLPEDLDDAASQRFESLWTPQHAGTYQLAVIGELESLGLIDTFIAEPAGLEARDPRPDHALLAALAEATDGAVLMPENLDQLPAILEQLGVPEAIIRPTETRRPFGPPWWPLIPILILLGAEWILRKVIKLV